MANNPALEWRPKKVVVESNPLEPKGCAACDRGERYTEARAYVHTGMGAYCRGKQLCRPAPADPAPPSRVPLSVNGSERPAGKYKCGNCGGFGHNARGCSNPKKE